MNTIKSFLVRSSDKLGLIYSDGSEIRAILQLLLMDALSLSQTDLLLADKDTVLSDDVSTKLASSIDRLCLGEPLQYVLGYAYFLDFKVTVSPAVLIPRPETEELVSLIQQDFAERKEQQNKVRVLDIGTGSGCIPLALSRLLDPSHVEKIDSLDISAEAVAIAQLNCAEVSHNIPIDIKEQDLFDLPHLDSSRGYDVIVSNPPYIHPRESADMTEQVLRWEPHKALFTPEDSPTLFYDEIGQLFHKGYINSKGSIYLEINPIFAQETLLSLTNTIGSENIQSADLILDLCGKERFIRIVLN